MFNKIINGEKKIQRVWLVDKLSKNGNTDKLSQCDEEWHEEPRVFGVLEAYQQRQEINISKNFH